MVKDYSTICITNTGRCRKMVLKKRNGSKSKEFLSATKLMWKTLGAILFVTVIIGISSSIWYGWQVRQALDQIGQDRIRNIALTNENRLLIAQHDHMLTREHMEEAAQEIGLYTPAKNQLRYP